MSYYCNNHSFVVQENRVKIIEAHLIDREQSGSSQMRLPGPPPTPSTSGATPASSSSTGPSSSSEAAASTSTTSSSSTDFYGSTLRLCLVAYLRPEKKFENLEALVNQINLDIKLARELYRAGECEDVTKIVPPAGKYHMVVGTKRAALQFFFTPSLPYTEGGGNTSGSGGSSRKYWDRRPAFFN
jgi:hypothetical protein